MIKTSYILYDTPFLNSKGNAEYDLTEMAQIMAQTCEFSCKEEATLYCKVCKQFLCIECRQTVHDKFPKYKDHAVVNVHQEGNCVFRPHPVCETHKDTFVFYCCKCECLTCAECMTSTHNEHKTEKIKNVADARRQNVNQIIEQLKTKVDIVKKKLETNDTEHFIQIQSDCESYVKKVEETVDDLHLIVNRHKLIPLTTASDFKDIENEDLGRKRVFFRRRHDETAIRLLKFENLLKEMHDTTFLTEWKALQTDVQMNNEETDDPLVAPRRIESFNQKKLTKFVIDEIDEKFHMKLREQEKAVARLTEGIGELRGELKEKLEQIDDLSKLARELKEKKNELVEENDKLKTEIKERKVQETSKLKEKEKRVNVLLEENDKLKSNIKGNQEEIADKKKMLNVLLEENVELKSCIQIKQYDLDSMSKLLQGLNENERMIKGLQDENNTLTTEYKQREMKANSQLKEKEKRMNVLLEENDKLKYKIQINQEELKEKEKSMNVLLEENDKLKYKIQINQEEEREENTIRQKTKLKETACIDYKDSRYEINPVLKQMAFKGKIIKILKERKIVFNPSTLDMTVSVEQLTSLNQQIIHEFGVDICIFEKEVPDLQAEGISYQTKLSPLKIKGDKVQLVAEFQLSYMQYRMLQFFCPECPLFRGSSTYKNGLLCKVLQYDEKEDDLKAILQAKLLYFQSLTTYDVPMPEGWTITDLKLKEIETELNIISPDIFFFLSKDAKTLTLKGSRYEILQMAKTKCEFILGIKQKGRGGRRARVISTDPSYKKEGNEQMGNKLFSQSMTPSRSSFSQSFSGASSSPSAPPLSADTFKTSEGLLIHVYVGNFLNLKVDCIVNAANETLSHDGGVADVISRAAGYGFQQESDDYIQRNGQLNVTDCCITSACSLPYQCVIHAVGPRWYNYNDKRRCANDLEETVKNCCKVAENRKMTSVAIPTISLGIFGVPREVCCKQYSQAVQDFSRKFGTKSCLKEIHFVDKDAGMISIIQKEFSQIYNAIFSTQ